MVLAFGVISSLSGELLFKAYGVRHNYLKTSIEKMGKVYKFNGGTNVIFDSKGTSVGSVDSGIRKDQFFWGNGDGFRGCALHV